jgi:hypothetical protein
MEKPQGQSAHSVKSGAPYSMKGMCVCVYNDQMSFLLTTFTERR